MQIARAIDSGSTGAPERCSAESISREVTAAIQSDVAEILQRESKEVIAGLRLEVERMLRRVRNPSRHSALPKTLGTSLSPTDRESSEGMKKAVEAGQERATKNKDGKIRDPYHKDKSDKTAAETANLSIAEESVERLQHVRKIEGNGIVPKNAIVKNQSSSAIYQNASPMYLMPTVSTDAAFVATRNPNLSWKSDFPLYLPSPSLSADESISSSSLIEKRNKRAELEGPFHNEGSGDGHCHDNLSQRQHLMKTISAGPRFLLSEPGIGMPNRRRGTSAAPLPISPQHMQQGSTKLSSVSLNSTSLDVLVDPLSRSLPFQQVAKVEVVPSARSSSNAEVPGWYRQGRHSGNVTVDSRDLFFGKGDFQPHLVNNVTQSHSPAGLNFYNQSAVQRDLFLERGSSSVLPGTAAANQRSGYAT